MVATSPLTSHLVKFEATSEAHLAWIQQRVASRAPWGSDGEIVYHTGKGGRAGDVPSAPCELWILIEILILIVSFPLCHSHLIGGLCVPPCDCFWRRSRTDFPETHVGGAPRNSCGRTTLRDDRRQAFLVRSATQLHQRQQVHRHGESPHLSMIQQHEQSACAFIILEARRKGAVDSSSP